MDGRNGGGSGGGGGVGGGEEPRISILTTLNNEKWCFATSVLIGCIYDGLTGERDS
jgi:hypothetical protein